MEDADVDPVGNDAEWEVRKVTIDKCLRWFAHRDSAVEVRQVRLEDWAPVEVADVRFGEGVERADVCGSRHSQHRDRQRRHERLMKVKYVESLALDDRRDSVG